MALRIYAKELKRRKLVKNLLQSQPRSSPIIQPALASRSSVPLNHRLAGSFAELLRREARARWWTTEMKLSIFGFATRRDEKKKSPEEQGGG